MTSAGSGLTRLRLTNDFPHRHLEPIADALERGELNVLLPALDRTVVGTVHLDVVREAFLAVLALFAMPAYDFADADLKRLAFHRFAPYMSPRLSLDMTEHFQMEPDEFIPDPPLSPEEARVAASLSPDFVERMDRELLSHAKPRNRKVAMIVALAMSNPAVRAPGLPDLYYAQRVRALVAKGALVAEGNLDYMRYSEVRLPG